MGNVILEVKDLKVSFYKRRREGQAVRDVNFTLEEGQTLGIVGETGAGKTTTCLSILRLISSTSGQIQEGEILFEGNDILKKSESEMRKIRGQKISMIFQDPMTALNPVIPVGKQISEVIRKHQKCSRTEATARAGEMLNKVGIAPERASDYPHQFSGGMKQRVVIAMALACNPKLLLADEPTTALDVTIQAQIMDLLKELQLKEGKSIILITHNMGLVAEMADEVCVMYMGRVVEFGSLEDLFDRTSHPYTRALLRSVPVLGLADGQKLETIPGATPNPADLKGGCEFADRCSECMERCREKTIPMFEISPGHRVRCLKFDSYPEVD